MILNNRKHWKLTTNIYKKEHILQSEFSATKIGFYYGFQIKRGQTDFARTFQGSKESHSVLESYQVLKTRGYIWDKVFKNGGPSKICGRQLLKNLKEDHTPSNFLKVVFHKFYLIHSWIVCSISDTNITIRMFRRESVIGNSVNRFLTCFIFGFYKIKPT